MSNSKPKDGPAMCTYGNQQYPPGTVICIEGELNECVDGDWQAKGPCEQASGTVIVLPDTKDRP
jgi:hypothetical protein